MTKFIQNVNRNSVGNITGCNYDEKLFTPVIGMLNRNNTFCPAIRNIIKNGPFTKVFFVDGTSVSVKLCDKDTDSVDAAIAFAVFKRLYGIPDEKGEIQGAGFSTYLKKLIEGVFDQKAHDDEVKAAKRAKQKESEPKTAPKKTKKPVKKSVTPARDKTGRFLPKH